MSRSGNRSKMGRNPFEHKPRRAIDFLKEMEKEPPSERPREGFSGKLARFVLVDLRAESYLFGLKAYLLSLSLFE